MRILASALGDVEEAGEDEQVLADGQVDVQGDLLGDDPGHRLDGPVVDVRRQAVHDQGPGRHRRDAVDHPDGRRLAGPVRAEEAEALALADVEVDPVHGREVAVLLGQAAGGNERRHGAYDTMIAGWRHVS